MVLVISYVIISLCIFKSFLVFWKLLDSRRTQNWEIAILLIASIFWLPGLVLIFLAFVLFGPLLGTFRLIRGISPVDPAKEKQAKEPV